MEALYDYTERVKCPSCGNEDCSSDYTAVQVYGEEYNFRHTHCDKCGEWEKTTTVAHVGFVYWENSKGERSPGISIPVK